MHLRWISFSFGLDNLMRFSDCDIENKVKNGLKIKKRVAVEIMLLVAG